MTKAKIIVIAMLSLLMTAAAFAQPAKKRIPPRQAAIWGMETDYSTVIAKPRTNLPRASSIGNGGAGGAALGVKMPRTRQQR